jgi:hypothetical protein
VPNLGGVDQAIVPLIGPGFDAIEQIEQLGKAGFQERLRVRAGPPPDAILEVGELRAAAEPLGFAVELVQTN